MARKQWARKKWRSDFLLCFIEAEISVMNLDPKQMPQDYATNPV